jgi:hypothetical protein
MSTVTPERRSRSIRRSCSTVRRLGCSTSGGWPGLRGRSVEDALLAVRDYLEEIARVDVGRVDGTQRDPSRVRRLLVSLARNVATHAAATSTGCARRQSGTSSTPRWRWRRWERHPIACWEI